MREVLDRILDLFSPKRIGAYLSDDLIPDLVVGIATVLVTWLIWRALDRAVRAMLEKSELDRTAVTFVRTILRYTVMTIGVVTGLAQFGVDTTSLLTSLGVAGLTIGFAARDTLSNIISGLFIFWDRPFVIGDLIEIDGKYGRVEDITMRSTRVVTVDGRMLAVPNGQIVNQVVASYTNFPHLRLDVDFTVGVGEDLGRVREIALSCAVGDAYMNEPGATVVVTALNDYNVAMQLRVWLGNEREHIAARAALREQVFEALRGADVDMPFETLALVKSGT